MMTNKNAAIKSPVFGGIILTVMFILYSLTIIPSNEFKDLSTIIKTTISIFAILPFLFLCFLIISYLFSIPIGIVLFKIKQNFLLSSGVFWFLSFLIGLFLGLLIAYFNYKYENNLVKSIFIVISLSMMSTFNSSLFSVLTGDIKNKYKYENNESKGERN